MSSYFVSTVISNNLIPIPKNLRKYVIPANIPVLLPLHLKALWDQFYGLSSVTRFSAAGGKHLREAPRVERKGDPQLHTGVQWYWAIAGFLQHDLRLREAKALSLTFYDGLECHKKI